MNGCPRYEIEKFHSIPELAQRFGTYESHIIKAIEDAGIRVIDKSTYFGVSIAMSNGNRNNLRLENSCTYIQNARYHPKVDKMTEKPTDEEIEKARQAFVGIRFVCEPPFTGCELIGVIEAYHSQLKEELITRRWLDLAEKGGMTRKVAAETLEISPSSFDTYRKKRMPLTVNQDGTFTLDDGTREWVKRHKEEVRQKKPRNFNK